MTGEDILKKNKDSNELDEGNVHVELFSYMYAYKALSFVVIIMIFYNLIKGLFKFNLLIFILYFTFVFVQNIYYYKKIKNKKSLIISIFSIFAIIFSTLSYTGIIR